MNKYDKYIPIGVFLFFIAIGFYGAIINYLKNEIVGSLVFLSFGIIFICLLPMIWREYKMDED